MNAIELKNVSRSFGHGREKLLAVDDLSLVIPRGSVYGLLGANGAGKTTLIRMMLSHLKPGLGEIRVLGEKPACYTEGTRRKIAYISENMQLPRWMNIEDAIGFSKAIYPQWNDPLCKELLTRFDLKPNKRYDECSKGQKRAICIILAISQEPEVLIMDEPASGLDTLARRHFLSEILKITCDENKTVLFSSHILGDIERTVDRIVIMNKGRMVLEGELDTLKENVRKITIRGALSENIERNLFGETFQRLRTIRSQDGLETIVTDFSEEKLQTFKRTLPESVSLEIEGFNLEEMFVESIQREN